MVHGEATLGLPPNDTNGICFQMTLPCESEGVVDAGALQPFDEAHRRSASRCKVLALEMISSQTR